jgi:hypothetical protein
MGQGCRMRIYVSKQVGLYFIERAELHRQGGPKKKGAGVAWQEVDAAQINTDYPLYLVGDRAHGRGRGPPHTPSLLSYVYAFTPTAATGSVDALFQSLVVEIYIQTLSLTLSLCRD